MGTPEKRAKPEGKAGVSRDRLSAALSQVSLNAAGVDVGASSHFAAVPPDRSEPAVREFKAFTTELYRLAD